MSLNQNPFLTNGNYQKVVGFLRQQYATRMGVPAIPERVDTRLQKTVQHYMTEVAKVSGGQKPVQTMNQEVVRETTVSMDSWLKRQEAPPSSSIKRPPLVSTAPLSRPIPATPSYEDVNALFSMEKQSATSFLAPDIQYPARVQEEEEDPVVLMKRAHKLREEELMRSVSTAPRMEIKEIPADATMNPTPQTVPPPIRTTPLPQDYIIPQEPIVKYLEKEYNVFITSSDRDWYRNRSENRYNFSVLFNAGNRSGFGMSPSVQERFRNVQRIEFVKALLPTESLVSLVRVTEGPIFNAARVLNVLSLPFVGVRIAELNNNGFSTNPREDNTFAIVQYDATWNSSLSTDSSKPAKSCVGYTAFIPKFLKCQRVYEPTPLAGLQKMSLRIERHDGSVLGSDSDVQSIQRICLSSNVSAIGTSGSVYELGDNGYSFVQTAQYFPAAAFGEGDTLSIQGYIVDPASPTPAPTTKLDFENYINAPGGLYVVAIAHVNGAGVIVDGANEFGYANILILRSRYDDPATGSVSRSGAALFGGSPGEEAALATQINGQAPTTAIAALINLSRQTHFVLRIVTRDLDSGSNIRPDNV
jgi:hypothetical protein